MPVPNMAAVACGAFRTVGCNRKLTEQSGAWTAAGRAERAKRRGNPNVMFPQRHLLTIGFGELLRNGLAFGARVLEPLLRKEPLARRRRIERHLLEQLGEFLKETEPFAQVQCRCDSLHRMVFGKVRCAARIIYCP